MNDIKAIESGTYIADAGKSEDAPEKAIHPLGPTRSSSSTTSSGGTEEQALAKWRKTVMLIYDEICNHKHGPVFLHAVKPETPNYYQTIKRPMDLSMIKMRLRDGVNL